jgi:hypothetical protein
MRLSVKPIKLIVKLCVPALVVTSLPLQACILEHLNEISLQHPGKGDVD